MPSYDLSSAQLSQLGPIIQVVVGPSVIQATTLRAQGLPVPGSSVAMALVDTGAGGIAISGSLAVNLGLPVIDIQRTLTPSTKQAEERPVYGISLGFPNGPLLPNVPAVDVDLDAQGIHMLLGRLLLTIARLQYDGRTNHCTLIFDDPQSSGSP